MSLEIQWRLAMKLCLQCNKDISHKRNISKYCSLSCSAKHNRSKILQYDLPPDHKRCGKCKEVKSFDQFRKNKMSSFGYSYFCKNCDKQRIYAKDKRKILLNSAKKRAKDNNLEFNLTLDDIVLPKVCPILGIQLQFNDKIAKDNSFSVDRINPEMGYVRGNIEIISFKANTIKNNATLHELELVYRHVKNIKTKEQNL